MTKINLDKLFLPKSMLMMLFALFLSSCGNINKYSDADFGGHQGYKEKIEKVILRTAKNPDSVTIKSFSEPKKTLISNTSLSGIWNPWHPAYGVCVKYKGTNSYGGMIETTENFYMRHNDVVYNYINAQNNGNGYDVSTLDRYKPCLNQ
jgi:hypothetical protein